MKRRTRFAFLAAYLSVGGIVLQLSGCFDIASTVGVASFDIGLLTDDDGKLFGVFAVCGQPNVLVVSPAGVPLRVEFEEDDLVFNCPISQTVTETAIGGGGTGGGGT